MASWSVVWLRIVPFRNRQLLPPCGDGWKGGVRWRIPILRNSFTHCGRRDSSSPSAKLRRSVALHREEQRCNRASRRWGDYAPRDRHGQLRQDQSASFSQSSVAKIAQGRNGLHQVAIESSWRNIAITLTTARRFAVGANACFRQRSRSVSLFGT
jgi:hypothetical protein